MKAVKRGIAFATAALLLLCSLLCFTACANEQKLTFFALDTVISIRIIKGGSQQIVNEAQREVMRLDEIFDRFDGELARINRNGGGKMSPELAQAVKAALALCESTDGAFDVTVGAVSSLWDFKNGVVPSDEDLLAALERVDHKLVELDGDVIALNGAILDLGAFAKGYICDLIAQFLKTGGVSQAILDFGGNILVIGDKSGNGYSIGVADPNGNEPIYSFNAKDCSAVTSGIYQRCFEMDGIVYHHILDTKSGYPVNNELASVTVVCGEAARADALSTAMMVMGPKKARQLALDERVRAIFVYKDGTVEDIDGQ